MIWEFLAVGLGGFIGACLRFAITKATLLLQWSFPLGTLLSNVVAGVAIGVIIGLEQHSVTLAPKTKLFLTTGLLGGLSTFSTFSAETVQMLGDGRYLVASGNILLNLALSLLGVGGGLFIVHALFKKA